MLHHVSLEVEPERVEDCVACWRLLGFEPVAAPAALGDDVTWLERAGTQVHLIHVEGATAPRLGHAAVVVEDFEATFAALEADGRRPERRRRLWGQPRASVEAGGHRVEFMAAPPG